MMYNELRQKLIEVAKSKKVITYEELGSLFHYNMKNIDNRNKMYHDLGEISRYEVEQGRPMLSAVVVLKNNKPPTPGDGFFLFAIKELGILKEKESRELFFAKELGKVYTYWKNGK